MARIVVGVDGSPASRAALRLGAEIAEQLLADSIAKHGIDRDPLTVHADNGSSMVPESVRLPASSSAGRPSGPASALSDSMTIEKATGVPVLSVGANGTSPSMSAVTPGRAT